MPVKIFLDPSSIKKSLIVIALISSLSGYSQQSRYDSVAILIMERMANVIGDLGSCSFKLVVANDVWEPPRGLIKYFSDYEVYMSGPDKMLVNAHGRYGHRQFTYNGTQFVYYSYNENNYGIIPTPDSILNMVDSLHETYDIEFPAIDFFYPYFTEDLMNDADSIRFIRMETIGSREYFHLIAFGKEINFQFWIDNDAYNLPARFSITYKNKEGTPQYMAMFSDWQLNPTFPDAMFDFLPPPNATELRILSKNEK